MATDPIEMPPEVVITMHQLLTLAPKEIDWLLLMGLGRTGVYPRSCALEYRLSVRAWQYFAVRCELTQGSIVWPRPEFTPSGTPPFLLFMCGGLARLYRTGTFVVGLVDPATVIARFCAPMGCAPTCWAGRAFSFRTVAAPALRPALPSV
jgi:hypothetical protein